MSCTSGRGRKEAGKSFQTPIFWLKVLVLEGGCGISVRRNLQEKTMCIPLPVWEEAQRFELHDILMPGLEDKLSMFKSN